MEKQPGGEDECVDSGAETGGSEYSRMSSTSTPQVTLWEAHTRAGSCQNVQSLEERSPRWIRFAGRACDPMGGPCWSPSLKACTPQKEPTLKQFGKNCSPWEGLMLKFIEDSLPWEGHLSVINPGAGEGLLSLRRKQQ